MLAAPATSAVATARCRPGEVSFSVIAGTLMALSKTGWLTVRRYLRVPQMASHLAVFSLGFVISIAVTMWLALAAMPLACAASEVSGGVGASSTRAARRFGTELRRGCSVRNSNLSPPTNPAPAASIATVAADGISGPFELTLVVTTAIAAQTMVAGWVLAPFGKRRRLLRVFFEGWLRGELRRAVTQPDLGPARRRLAGFECLVRWQHPRRACLRR